MKGKKILSLLLGLFFAQNFAVACAKDNKDAATLNSTSNIVDVEDVTEKDPEKETVTGNGGTEGPTQYMKAETLDEQFSNALTQKYLKTTEMDRLSSLGVSADDYVNVIVTLKGDNLLDRYLDANFGGEVAEYVATDGSSARQDMLTTQNAIKQSIAEIDAGAEFLYSYTLAQNGFAARVRYGALDEIKQISSVESVTLSERYATPDGSEKSLFTSSTGSATEGTGTSVLPDDEYLGEGTLIAVMDTALDTTHPAFAGDCIDMAKAKVSSKDVATILESTDAFYWDYTYNYNSTKPLLTVEDVYLNNKLVFTYDYGNKDADVKPYQGFGNELEHGTHTSGIAVGYDEAAGYCGVAPMAQLAFMKVFYEDFTNGVVYSEDIYIAAAIEDSIMLGVDAINLSLGAARGFSVDNTSVNYIYQYCYYADLVGISVQASVGNSFTAAYDGLTGDYPAIWMPDYGAANSPATFDSTLAIGSYNGTNVNQYYAHFNEGTENSCNLYYTDPETGAFIDTLGEGTYTWVYVDGDGTYEDMKVADVKGKIVLVKRNDRLDAVQQMLNAQRLGAIAILFSDADYRMVCTTECKILNPLPYAAMALVDAERLFSLGGGTVRIAKNQIRHNLMSAFSSWGTTNTLTLKPEVVAVGGNVYSSLISANHYGSVAGYYPHDYGYLSGSSMAAPAATAYVARLRQAFEQRYPDLSDRELSALVSQMIMSTAKPLTDLNDTLYSPRYQGAGAIDYEGALTADEYLSVTGSKKPKIELGEDPDKTGEYFLHFNINNLSVDAQTYVLSMNVLTDSLCADGKTVSLIAHTLHDYTASVAVSNGVYDATTNSVIVEGESSATIAIKLTLGNDSKAYLDQFDNGTYVEGFVRLQNGASELSLPYLAFYGDWEEAPLMDKTIYEDEEGYVFESMIIGTYNGGLSSAALGQYLYVVPEGYEEIGFDERLISIGSATGGFNAISSLYVGLMRHADSLEFYIMDAATGEIYEYNSLEQIGRASYIESSGQMYPVIQGLNYGSGLPNNTELNIVIRAGLDNMGNTVNDNDTTSFRIVVDSEIPRFYTDSVGIYQENGRTYLSVNVIDNNMVTSLWLYTYTADGYQEALGEPLPVYPWEFKPKEKNTLVYDITDYAEKFNSNVIGFIIEDAAMNRASYSLTVHADFEKDEEPTDEVVYAKELTYDKTVNVASGYSVDLGIKTVPANASYKLTVVPVRGYTGSAIVDEERQLVVARNPGYVRIQIESGDICVTSDMYVYVNDGEWVYEVVAKGNNWIKSYYVEDDMVRTDSDTSFNYDPENGQTTEYYMVSVYRGEGSHVVVPSSYTDADGVEHEVVAIGMNAFFACQNMYSVTIPNTIRHIGFQAFIYNFALTEVIFEENSQLRTIESFAFAYDESLRGVEIPKSVNWIADRAFDDNYSMTSLTFEAHTVAEGASLLYIGSTAFDETQITELVFPETLVTLGAAFAGAKIKRIVLPENMTAVASRAFEGCTYLEEVVLPDGIETISMSAFEGCTSLKKINMPSSLTQIGALAFAGCSSLTSIELPDTVEKIGSGAFGYCTSLVSVKFGDGLKEIDDEAFLGATSLRTVYFDRYTKLETLGTDLFYGCMSFTDFSVHPLNENFMSDDGILYRKIPGSTHYQLHTVPIAKRIDTFLVRPDVAEINDFAFAYHTEMQAVLFPAGGALYSIGDYAFTGCSSLKTVGLQNATALLEMGDYVFAYCTSLTDIVLPNNITKIPSYAFYYCVYLERVEFNEQLSSIGSNAFAYCIRFQGTDGEGTLKLPAALSTLNAQAFVANRQLKKVDLSDCVGLSGKSNYWGEYGFAECTNLREVILPTTANMIFDGMFAYCTSLEKINLEETQIDNIRTYAFYGCESLEHVVLPETIETIYAQVFVNTAIKTLTIPDMGENGRIMSKAFALNPYLETLYLPDTFVELEAYVFAETGLKEVHIPSSITRSNFDHRAFYLCSKLERFIVDEDNEYFGVTKEGILYTKEYKQTSISGDNIDVPATLFICPLNAKADTLVIGEEFEEIPANFFQLTSNIRKIVVPETVKTIGAGAFSYSRVEEVEFAADSPVQFSGYSETNLFDGCEQLTKVVLPENLNCITAQMFYGCINLEEIVLPESVKTIYDGAFYGCEKLKNINLEHVENIEGSAFGYCLSLEKLNIGSVTNSICFDLNYTAFEGCKGLTEITVDPQNKMFKSIDGVLFDKKGSVLYVYPAAKAGSEYSIPEGVTKIAEYAFGENRNLKKVVLPNTLAVVGAAAFYKTAQLDTYVFLSEKAPVLEGQYSRTYGLTLYMNFLDISQVYFDYPLYLYHKEGATGYDMFLYREFFYEAKTLEDVEYVPSPDQPIEDCTDGATGKDGEIETDYVVRFTAYVEELKKDALDGLKAKLDALVDQFETEYDAFFDMFADDQKAQERFYNSYVAEADKLYQMDVELYAARWVRIHEVIELIADLKTTYTYSEEGLETLDTIAYSTQYILVRSYTLEEIEKNYVYYRDFVLGVPKADEEQAFSEYLTTVKADMETGYETFLAEKSSLYDEDVLEEIEIEYTDVVTRVAQAKSRSLIEELLDGWDYFLANVVTAENRAAFETEKAAIIATLDDFKEEDYEYALWLVMKEYKENQLGLVESMFVLDEVRKTVEFTYNELASQESKLQSRKQAALNDFDTFIEYYNMYSYLYDANMKELRLIVAEEIEKIENVTTVAEVADALDAGFDRVWKYFEYHQKAYTEYRRALEAFAALSDEDKSAAMAELNAISYRVATNSDKIIALIEKYCGEKA